MRIPSDLHLLNTSIHLHILFLVAVYSGSMSRGCWSLSQHTWGKRQETAADSSPVHRRAHRLFTHPSGHFDSPINQSKVHIFVGGSRTCFTEAPASRKWTWKPLALRWKWQIIHTKAKPFKKELTPNASMGRCRCDTHGSPHIKCYFLVLNELEMWAIWTYLTHTILLTTFGSFLFFLNLIMSSGFMQLLTDTLKRLTLNKVLYN